jgi:hypothetical protein
MPTPNQHVEKILRGCTFIEADYAVKHADELIVAYFYTAMHMFECDAYDFLNKKHFRSHTERANFFHATAFDSQNVFFGTGNSYGALRRLSERARYLSATQSNAYDPIVPQSDLPAAKQICVELRKNFEAMYTANKMPVPWIKTGAAAVAAKP